MPLTRAAKAGAAGIGLVLGVVLGMTSVGSGALVGLALIIVFRLTPHRVVGTDVFHAALMLWAAGLAHLLVGNVDLVLMANILVGLAARRVARHRAAAARPRRAPCASRSAACCSGSALGVLSKAGVDIPKWTIVAVPALVGLIAFAIVRLRARAPEVATA